jgi:excisionase family DNA binding protein
MKTENQKFGNGGLPAENFIGKTEVARRLNRSLKTVSNWMRRGILPYYKLGHRVSFRWSEVEAHIQANYLRAGRQIWGQAHFSITNNLSECQPAATGSPLPRRGIASPWRGSESRHR